jgi:hypothetical protein
VYTLNESRAKLRARHHFLTTALTEPKMFIVGGDDDLITPVATRIVDRTADQPKRHPEAAAARARFRRQRD